MKKCITLLAGGESPEHAVSLLSSKYILKHIDRSRFDVSYIGIDPAGGWYLFDTEIIDALPFAIQELALPITQGRPLSIDLANKQLYETATGTPVCVDGIFPILHGPKGEDGTVQGLLELLGIPFVGAKQLGSAIGMDKDIMKRLLQHAQLPVTPYEVLRKDTVLRPYEQLVQDLGLPMIVKPANMGSSVGVSKVQNADEFAEALEEAFRYDSKVLCEAFVSGREIECAVLEEQGVLTTSLLGEIVLAEVYSYEEKYLPTSHATAHIPASIDEETKKHAQTLAKEVFTTLECRHLGRVDMFLREDGTLLVNEINTLPGFTNISMYPALMQASGISYRELLTRLCQNMWEV